MTTEDRLAECRAENDRLRVEIARLRALQEALERELGVAGARLEFGETKNGFWVVVITRSGKRASELRLAGLLAYAMRRLECLADRHLCANCAGTGMVCDERGGEVCPACEGRGDTC